jgi:threonine/homoserine/homoserine lactone efflux protein
VFVVVRVPRGEDGNVDLTPFEALAGPFARGLALGLAVAAPVGPMSLLCMRQPLARGFRAGFSSGLGIATADGLNGAVAAFGLVAIADLLVGQQPWLRVVGGAAMVYLGVGALRAGSAETAVVAGGGRGLARSYAATFALTMMNPATILSFAALFAGLGLGAGGTGAEAEPASVASTPLAMVSGVFLGSALWWLALTGSLALARARVSTRAQRTINVAAGLALAGFGLAALGSALA